MDQFLKKCEDSVLAGDADTAFALASEAIGGEIDILQVIESGFVSGIREVGRLWEEGEYFLPELVMGAEAVKKALSVLEPALAGQELSREVRGVGVIGTVQGDIHDIGKTLVGTMLSASGFEVYDLGTDVSPARFISEAEAREADFIGASALLTTTMPGQRALIEMLAQKGCREDFLVVVGGAPCSEDWAESIGAAGYATDAVAAVELIGRLLDGKGGRTP
ncbi:MAG: dimethylamine corrinoid protein 3 [Candidatus Latescibacteria bacterium]|nr:dimethylamine corrinoid protein 3 [bacterium]MBD3425535.1 dimethylamine corrinoid protein 3 [Candidatus Latescibacterota bacterium]